MPSACSSSTRRRDGREDKEVCRVRLHTVSLPRLCGARSAPYYRVYPKTVRRTVVLCRGGPRGRPPPGNHKGCPYGCTSAFGLRMVAGMNFSVASPYVQIYRRRGTTSSFPVHLSVSNLNCVPCA